MTGNVRLHFQDGLHKQRRRLKPLRFEIPVNTFIEWAIEDRCVNRLTQWLEEAVVALRSQKRAASAVNRRQRGRRHSRSVRKIKRLRHFIARMNRALRTISTGQKS